MKTLGRFLLPVAIALLGLGLFTPEVSSQSPITIKDGGVDIQFPDSLTFHMTASTTNGSITQAWLVYSFDFSVDEEGSAEEEMHFVQAPFVQVEHELDLSDLTTPPGMPISYYWQAADSDGNVATTPVTTIRFEDDRFDWQIRQDDRIAVWWHDKPATFGEKVFVIARQAVQRQYELFGVSLDYQMRIVVYNDHQEFDQWHNVIDEWAGGRAFPYYGITAQVVTEDTPEDLWLMDVVPHEISHLNFVRLIPYDWDNDLLWFNEGVAQYNEFGDHSRIMGEAYTAAYLGQLERIEVLNGMFHSMDDQRIHLAYIESYSLIHYLVDAYGEDGLGRLLEAYADGLLTAQAFPQALGIPLLAFEQDWANYMGLDPQILATSTATSPPPPRPSPTPHLTRSTPTVATPAFHQVAPTSTQPFPSAVYTRSNAASGPLLGAALLTLGVMLLLGLALGRRLPR